MWANQELLDRPVRAAYGELFSAYVAATGNSETLELVVGVGCLAWNPPSHPTVHRHLLTAPVNIRFDDEAASVLCCDENYRSSRPFWGRGSLVSPAALRRLASGWL